MRQYRSLCHVILFEKAVKNLMRSFGPAALEDDKSFLPTMDMNCSCPIHGAMDLPDKSGDYTREVALIFNKDGFIGIRTDCISLTIVLFTVLAV
ncbi:MAG: hypothetical protein Q8Q33_07745 [Chlamydiota bacterium]|nr:hypothetical protein [Chlamydiota bacterium]